MPKLVSELAQGKSFSRSAEGGELADQATRTWKILLNTPNESFIISDVVGVNIGDPLGSANPIPCVSLEARADGESRLVRIVTAQYRSTAGVGSTDPGTLSPLSRPATYSMSTSLTEIACWGGSVVTGNASGVWSPAINPAGDIVDGITRLEPVVTINIEQYSQGDMSQMLGYCGMVNSDSFVFSGLTIGTHCCMLQSISSQSVVETFGNSTFRGFKVTFGFAVRAHWTVTRSGYEAIGWDIAVPLCGRNIINSQGSDVDADTLMYETKEGKVTAPLTLVKPGSRCPAQVTLAAGDGGWAQVRAADPVPLNDDGTPRSRGATPPVLINRICIQPEMAFGSNFASFGIRWFA